MRNDEPLSIYRQLRIVAALLLSYAAVVPGARALDGHFRIGDYHHDVWGPKEGAPSTVLSIAQTSDGWLWLGTYRGLYRFDGVQFERFVPLPGESLTYSAISTLAAAPNGDLLIAYLTGGFSILRSGHLAHMTSVKEQPFANTFTVLADVDGTYWIGAIDGLMHLDGRTWERVGAAWHYPGTRTDNLALDRYGRLFVSDGARVHVLDRASRTFRPTGLRSVEMGADFVYDPAGALWIGTDDRMTPAAVDPGGARPTYKVNTPPAMTIRRLFDRDGNLWLATDDNDVCMLPRARLPAAAAFSTAALLTARDCTGPRRADRKVIGLLEDRDGNIWMATMNGLERFRHNRLRTIPYRGPSFRTSLARDAGGTVMAVAGGVATRYYAIEGMNLQAAPRHADATLQRSGIDGTVVLATPAGLVVRERGRERTIPYPVPGPAPTDPVRRLLQEGHDAFWVGWTRHGLWRYAAGAWSKPADYGTPVARAGDAADGRGNVWLAYANNTIVRLGPAGARKYDARDGVDVRVATFIDVQRDVLAAGDGGLQVLSGGRFRHVRAADPDVLGGINGLVIAPDGDRWFNTHRGVLHVRAQDWQAALRTPAAPLRYELLDRLDGFPDGAQIGIVATAAGAPDGRMWFAASTGIALYDPGHDHPATTPPPPVIRAVIANGRRFDPTETIRLAPGTDHIDVEFTALSYTVPERTVFRYRLDGVERDWQGPSDRRYASYANLGPGRYTFALQAALQGGEWSGQTARIGVEIRPYFTQTWWFPVLCALAAAGAAVLFYRWRLREVTARLHLLLRERQRIARTLHDTFLQSLQALVWRFEQIMDDLPAQHQDRQLLDLTLAQANEVMTEGRHQIVGLRPGSDASAALEARVAAMIESFRLRFPQSIELTVVNPDGASLVPIVADEAFHIAHEALRNALHHGQGTRVGVELHYTAAAFVLRVGDDGRGIEAAVLARGGRDGHWGLTGMRERARVVKGVLRIESGAAGTVVTLRVARRVAYGRSRRA